MKEEEVLQLVKEINHKIETEAPVPTGFDIYFTHVNNGRGFQWVLFGMEQILMDEDCMDPKKTVLKTMLLELTQRKKALGNAIWSVKELLKEEKSHEKDKRGN